MAGYVQFMVELSLGPTPLRKWSALKASLMHTASFVALRVGSPLFGIGLL